MEQKIIETADGPAPIGPYSQAVVAGNIIYISGQIALDPATGNMITGEIRAEAGRVMENLRAILKAAQADFSNVVKTTIFLTDMNNFSVVNEVYGTYFSENYPARETVAVSGLPKNGNVEISMIAYR